MISGDNQRLRPSLNANKQFIVRVIHFSPNRCSALLLYIPHCPHLSDLLNMVRSQAMTAFLGSTDKKIQKPLTQDVSRLRGCKG